MEWSDEDREALIAFTETIDSDDIKVKEQIKKLLLNNRFIMHVLNNEELENNDAEPDEYFGENILPYYLIPDTQTSTKNFICYEVSYEYSTSDRRNYGSAQKRLVIIFYVLCHQLDMIDDDTQISRHDLLAALLQHQFSYTTAIGGGRLNLISDVPSVTDTNYACRTLTFEQITDNNLVKTTNGTPWIVNKRIPE